MGRGDSYTAGSGARTPPSEGEKSDSRDEQRCEECKVRYKSAVKRSGRFDSRVLCSECVSTLSEEKTAKDQREYLQKIHDQEDKR